MLNLGFYRHLPYVKFTLFVINYKFGTNINSTFKKLKPFQLFYLAFKLCSLYVKTFIKH